MGSVSKAKDPNYDPSSGEPKGASVRETEETTSQNRQSINIAPSRRSTVADFENRVPFGDTVI